jgi:hypothetical protein
MKLTFVLQALDEFNTPVFEFPVDKEAAGVIILDAIGAGKLKAQLPEAEPAEETTERSTTKRKRGKRTCGNCGGIGHTARTCEKRAGEGVGASEKSENELEQTGKLSQIRELLQDGHTDEDVATQTGTPLRTIKYIRKQMLGRNEL